LNTRQTNKQTVDETVTNETPGHVPAALATAKPHHTTPHHTTPVILISGSSPLNTGCEPVPQSNLRQDINDMWRRKWPKTQDFWPHTITSAEAIILRRAVLHALSATLAQPATFMHHLAPEMS
jgi:hypothetical protein